jgi:type IV secretion system protein VirB9
MMRPTSLLVLALLAGTALAGPAHAVQEPRAGRWDARVRTVPYNAMNPVRLVGSTFTSTQIIFAVGETVTHVAIGDAEAWLPQPTGNLLFIKPIEVRQPTNMQVVTTRPDGGTRSYQFELVARPAPSTTGAQVASLDGTVPAPAGPATPFAIQFVYPEDAREAAIANRRRAATGEGERDAQARLAVDFFYGPRNWRYTAQGSRSIEPAEVSDNGRLTAFRFPGNSTVPTIYTIATDGQESIVPYSMRGDLAVVSTTAREFRLRYGGEVLRVFNLGFDPIGQNPGTGTTTPEVIRTIRESRQ